LSASFPGEEGGGEAKCDGDASHREDSLTTEARARYSAQLAGCPIITVGSVDSVKIWRGRMLDASQLQHSVTERLAAERAPVSQTEVALLA
jgi:hypothetical protein